MRSRSGHEPTRTIRRGCASSDRPLEVPYATPISRQSDGLAADASRQHAVSPLDAIGGYYVFGGVVTRAREAGPLTYAWPSIPPP